jgi:hypothetical protein
MRAVETDLKWAKIHNKEQSTLYNRCEWKYAFNYPKNQIRPPVTYVVRPHPENQSTLCNVCNLRRTNIKRAPKFCELWGSDGGDYKITLLWNVTPCSLIEFYQTTQRHIPQDVRFHRCDPTEDCTFQGRRNLRRAPE